MLSFLASAEGQEAATAQPWGSEMLPKAKQVMGDNTSWTPPQAQHREQVSSSSKRTSQQTHS